MPYNTTLHLPICPITDFPTIDCQYHPDSESFLYKILPDKSTIKVRVPRNHESWNNDPIYSEQKHFVAGLLLNGKLYDTERSGYFELTLDYIKQKLGESSLPLSPKDKYDYLLLYLSSIQKFDGEEIVLVDQSQEMIFYKKLYFKSREELAFYMHTLRNDGLISAEISGSVIITAFLTYRGLTYVVNLNKESSNSKSCFIAMSFSTGMGDVRQAIKDACVETSYTPILIDETHYDSDATINDAIIANLKKSRFCIADFTEQKDGVYFESGYALGQGKQVIYSCRRDYFKESHFDTNHFPHIIYDTPDELKTALINKINAWIR